MSVTRMVARNTLLQVIGRFLYLALSIWMIRLLTGYLGVEGYGQYGILIDYLGFFGITVDLGLYLIALKRITQTKDQAEKEKAIGELIGLRVVSGLLMFVLAALIIFAFPYDSGLKWAIVIGALAFFSFSMTQLFAGIFQGFLKAEYVAITEVSSRIVTVAAVLVCAYFELGLWAISLALIAGNGSGTILSVLLARKLIRLRVSFDRQAFARILREAMPIGAVLTLSYLYVRQDTLILSLHPHLPSGLTHDQAVGLYKAPFKLLETIQGFPALFMVALFPFMSRYIAENNTRLLPMCQKVFDFLMALALPLIVGTLLLAGEVIGFISEGPEWFPAILTLRILIFSVAFSFFNNFLGHLVIAKSEQKKLILPNLYFWGFNFVANLIIIPYFAYNGAALTTVLTELIMIAVNVRIVWSITGWRPGFSAIGRILLASLLMGGMVWSLQQLGLYFLLNAMISAIFYFFLLERFGALPDGITLRELISRLVHKGASPTHHE